MYIPVFTYVPRFTGPSSGILLNAGASVRKNPLYVQIGTYMTHVCLENALNLVDRIPSVGLGPVPVCDARVSHGAYERAHKTSAVNKNTHLPTLISGQTLSVI